MEGAVRRRRVPEYLTGRGYSREAFLAWAREQLAGEEPAPIPPDVLLGLRNGTITEITLRPRKAGFFAPTGEFIEAFDHSPGFGEDLVGAERLWNQEERDREWADHENQRFNKGTQGQGEPIGLLLWTHGRSIEEHSRQGGTSSAALIRVLDRRKGPHGYTRHAHQTCLDFYRWKPILTSTDFLAQWSWERIDALIRFSPDNRIRDRVAELFRRPPFQQFTDLQVAALLGTKSRASRNISSAEILSLFERIRSELKEGRDLEAGVLSAVARLVTGVP